jgi:antitoxin component HigA of HigAB toxin-antitoxin module
MNVDRYAELLAAARPVVIETEEEHDHMLSIAEGLMEKGDKISQEEEKLLAMVALLIEAFESQVEAEEDDDEEDDGKVEPPAPHETIKRLMDARGLSLHDVSDFFGNPAAARETLEGRRPLSRSQAKRLADFFRVPLRLLRP